MEYMVDLHERITLWSIFATTIIGTSQKEREENALMRMNQNPPQLSRRTIIHLQALHIRQPLIRLATTHPNLIRPSLNKGEALN